MPPQNVQPTQPVTPQPEVAPAPQVPVNNVLPVAKKRIPKWLKIVGSIVVVFIVIIVIAIFGFLSATKAPQKVSDQFVNDIQASNTSAAYGLTSSAFKGVTTQDQLDDIVQQVSPALQGQEKISGRTLAKSTSVPETAVFVYSVKTSDGTKYIKTELQKSGSVWQIINFKSSGSALDTSVE